MRLGQFRLILLKMQSSFFLNVEKLVELVIDQLRENSNFVFAQPVFTDSLTFEATVTNKTMKLTSWAKAES